MPAQYTRERFEAVFPVIADEVLAYMEHEGMPQDAREWMKKVRRRAACDQAEAGSSPWRTRS